VYLILSKLSEHEHLLAAMMPEHVNRRNGTRQKEESLARVSIVIVYDTRHL
jgi:hypothetical protein